MDIRTFAEREGISVQRARELARLGRIPAVRAGRSWVIPESFERSKASRRPLSAHSQSDLITYLNTRTFDHVFGTRRARLAERVRTLIVATNPAAVLREFFAGTELPEGPGGAAIVRAAMRGLDDTATEALRHVPRWVVSSQTQLAGLVRDARAVGKMDLAEASRLFGISRTQFAQLERRGLVAEDARAEQKALHRLGIQVTKFAVSQEK